MEQLAFICSDVSGLSHNSWISYFHVFLVFSPPISPVCFSPSSWLLPSWFTCSKLHTCNPPLINAAVTRFFTPRQIVVSPTVVVSQFQLCIQVYFLVCFSNLLLLCPIISAWLLINCLAPLTTSYLHYPAPALPVSSHFLRLTQPDCPLHVHLHYLQLDNNTIPIIPHQSLCAASVFPPLIVTWFCFHQLLREISSSLAAECFTVPTRSLTNLLIVGQPGCWAGINY